MLMIAQLVVCMLVLGETQATEDCCKKDYRGACTKICSYNDVGWNFNGGYVGVTPSCKDRGGTICKDVCGGCGQYGTGTKCKNGKICCCVDDSKCLCKDSCGTNLQPGVGKCCDKSKKCCVRQHDPCYYNTLLPNKKCSPCICERVYNVDHRLYNVARGKKTVQSTNYHNLKYLSHHAVDGSSRTFSTTRAQYEPYWRVDLGRNYKIGRVEVLNRIRCCGERFHDVDITIGPTLDNMKLCVHYKGPGRTGQRFIFCCPEAIVGRYVQLQITRAGGKEYLHIADLKAMAFY